MNRHLHYTKTKKYKIKRRLLNGESCTSLSAEYKIPYGTIGRWKWEAFKKLAEAKPFWSPKAIATGKLGVVQGTAFIDASKKKANKSTTLAEREIRKEYEKNKERNNNPDGLSIDWNKALIGTVIDMGLNAVNARREAIRQRLIAYIIGVVIGMAIGSLIMRALQ